MNGSIELFEFTEEQFVLFLGEGNFSFSSCLLNYLHRKLQPKNFSRVFVTCFQKEFPVSALLNVEYLRSLGADVLADIDSTKLEAIQAFVDLKFDKIIFNFPHVGGKMKIHLNRELLRNFFRSSRNVLKDSGMVVVSLCVGQGGTGFDFPRRWDDTWQIVEQAASSHYILSHVSHFPHTFFEDYSPNGYRSLEKRFNTVSGVVHCFKISEPLLEELTDDVLNDIVRLQVVDSEVEVHYNYKCAISSNPLLCDLTPQKHFVNKIKEIAYTFSDAIQVLDNPSPLYVPFDESLALCFVQGRKYSLRNSLISHLSNDPSLAFGLVFKKCSSDFNDFCSRCHCILQCSNAVTIAKTFFAEVMSSYDSHAKFQEQKDSEGHWAVSCMYDSVVENAIWSTRKDKNCEVVTVDIDILCSFLFNVPLRQIWCPLVKLDHLNNVLLLPSLYPLKFIFDISFSSQTQLDFEMFYHLLHKLPDNIIESVNLISVYDLSFDEKSYCFRLEYRSFSKPLSKTIAVNIHQKVVGKLLVKKMGVKIR